MLRANLRIDQYFSLILTFVLLALSGSLISDSWLEQNKVKVTLIDPPALVQVKTDEASSAAELKQMVSAESLVVMDAQTNDIILSKNPHKPLFPASTTKLMTALVARDYYETHQVITAGQEVEIEGTAVGIQPGECLSVKSLLAAILINSGNDAAMVLAEHYPGGYQAFINQMNFKANQLGLNQTHFTNAVGFDHPQQKISARDLALLSQQVMKDSLFREYVSLKRTQIFDLTGQISHQIYNTNMLLEEVQGVHGIKTGTTEGAGEVLVTWWDWQSRPLIIVVMGSADRYQDTRLIIDWLQQTVTWEELVSFEKTFQQKTAINKQ